MSYLLDTNVISEFTKTTPSVPVVDWLREHQDDDLFLSVITIGEIQQGIARLPESNRRGQLSAWLSEDLLIDYADRILPIDIESILVWGTLTAELIQVGRKMPVIDAMIAATALQHNLSLVTRNVADFAFARVNLVNPWNDETGS